MARTEYRKIWVTRPKGVLEGKNKGAACLSTNRRATARCRPGRVLSKATLRC